jgi:hypothetical protein
MTETTWSINQLERELSDGYVYTAHWTVQAVDGEYSSGSYGSIGLERPETELIAFEDLTKEIVIGWVKDKLGEESVTSIEESLLSQIEAKRTPTTANGLPWTPAS